MAARTAKQIERDRSAEGALLGLARGSRTGTHAQAAGANQDGGAAADSFLRGGQCGSECGRRGWRSTGGGIRTVAGDCVSRFGGEENPREVYFFGAHRQGRDQFPPALSRPTTPGR